MTVKITAGKELNNRATLFPEARSTGRRGLERVVSNFVEYPVESTSSVVFFGIESGRVPTRPVARDSYKFCGPLVIFS